MKFSVLALDYDGTIAQHGVFDAAVRGAIGEVRDNGIVVALVTGRRLADLKQAAGDLTCFDVVVAENGAVLEFPSSGRHVTLGHAPSQAFLDELKRRGTPFTTGESVVEADALWAGPVLEAIRALELPLTMAFNRGRLMVLPPAIGKSTGLRQALSALRVSTHNAVAIGDAENDHDLLDTCEVGVAVGWGSPALKAVADEVIDGTGPTAVADYIRRVAGQPRLSATQMGRRYLSLGREANGDEVRLAVRGRTILIAGEPGTGKSWLAGLICEQSILQGYCLCVIDPEGEYQSLEALPGVITLGGNDPPPHARELLRAFRHPDVSVIVDLSKVSHLEKREYVRTLLPLLADWRRTTGLPHKILLDEAHCFLRSSDVAELIDPALAGYIFVTYRTSGLPESVRATSDAVVLVTRETDPLESNALLAMCRPCGAGVSANVFRDLKTTEAALLPGAAEARGQIRRFRLAPRLTAHVRHRLKYLDMPVVESQAFVFTDDGTMSARATTLKELTGMLAALPADRLHGHFTRHDFSRWIEDVFRDRDLAAHVRTIESRAGADEPRDVAEAIGQSIRARYETGNRAPVAPALAPERTAAVLTERSPIDPRPA